nr:amidohydrolase [Dissulfurirhabdus thermomarina]
MVLPEPAAAPIRDGAVAVRGGTIAAVGPWAEVSARHEGARLLDRKSGGLVFPGLVNAHTHAPMTLFRGLADDLPLKAWLEDHIFPAEARLTRELVALGTELACAEMIRCGTTGFVDMYLFEEEVARVVDRVGMRAWLGEGVFDFPTPAFPSGRAALAETERLAAAWGGHPRITITVDPHTPYTCAPELMEAARDLAGRLDLAMVTHLAETRWEVEEITRRHGKTPAAYLDALGLLGERLLAAHCVALTPEDIRLLAERDVRVAHCPESNLKLASGIAPVPELLAAGVIVTLGTDGAASNNDLDLLSEMDTAAKLPKGLHRDPTLVSATEALAMATTQAARALHRPDLGRLAPGAAADLVVVDLDQAHLRPCYHPASQLVYAARSGDVRDVVVAGRLLMEDRHLVTIDETDILARVDRAARELGLGPA